MSVPTLGPVKTKYIKDDWPFPVTFESSPGVSIDMSGSTFVATLIVENPSYVEYAITGAYGTVDTSHASTGLVVVTVSDALTQILTPDMDSVDLMRSASTSFTTRLVLIGTSGSVTTTWAVIPIRVVRR